MDLNDFDLVPIEKISKISSPKNETLYDITTDYDHSFFIHLPNQNIDVLSHNCDGSNIASMLFGWWYRMCPSFYTNHKIYKLNTPVVILKDSKDKIRGWFFSFEEFKKWEKENKDSKLKIIYLKGLGSLETSDLDYIISKSGFDSLLDEYVLDEKSDEYFKNWLGPDPVPRKKYLKEYELDIDRI